MFRTRSSPLGGPRLALLVGPVVGVALLLGACSRAADSGGTATAGEPPPAVGAAAGTAAQSRDVAVSNGPAGLSVDKALAQPSAASQTGGRQRLIRTAEVTVEVKELAPAAARVRQVAINAGGTVSSETTGYSTDAKPVTTLDDKGQSVERAARAGQSVLILRVPEPDLDRAIDGLSGIGKELSRTSSSQDVTGDIADVTSRVATQTASVARVRQLLAKAASLQDVVLLESELTKRESDLEALQARLASLSDRADLATLTVVLQTPDVPANQPAEDNGFLRGLHSGWHAVVESTTVVLTVLGALLPLAIVLLLVGWPAALLARRRRRPAPPAGPTPSARPTDPPQPPADASPQLVDAP